MKIPDYFGNGMPDDIGYVPPITLIVGEIETKMENDTIQAVQRYGIDVNRDELIKALNYDRDQYEKGFTMGYSRGYWNCKTESRIQGEWLGGLFCSNCGISKNNFFTVIRGENGDRSRPFGTWNYCPNCGAEMLSSEEIKEV